MQENFEENIGLLIHDVARLLRVLYDRQMASIGLTRSQWWLLTYLRFRDGINQSELGVLMDIEKAPLSRLIDRMELKGWIVRKVDGKDGRIKNIYLSDNVCKIPESLPPLDCNAEITFLAGDCNNVRISPISSSLDFTFTRDSN